MENFATEYSENENGAKKLPERRKFIYEYEDELDFNSIKYSNIKTKSINNNKNDYKYHERDLHKLLSTFLQNQNPTIYSKTVLHEKSYNSKDNTQKWIHPDMIGVEFLSLKSKTTQSLIKLSNNSKTFKLISYEIKREIQTDSELKKSYFQAVSNSSWANYGYLVLLDINSNLIDELQRLNESFGIGVIKLTKDIYDSKILFEARYKELDFKTIDKLCNINTEYNDFISLIEKYLNANEKYKEISLNELKEFSDDYFKSEDEIITYCKKNNIRDDD